MQVKFGSWNFGAVGSGFARPKVQDPSVCSSKTQLYAGKFWVLGGVARVGAVNTSVHITAHQDPRPKIPAEIIIILLIAVYT